jgi:hypothetical protein
MIIRLDCVYFYVKYRKRKRAKKNFEVTVGLRKDHDLSIRILVRVKNMLRLEHIFEIYVKSCVFWYPELYFFKKFSYILQYMTQEVMTYLSGSVNQQPFSCYFLHFGPDPDFQTFLIWNFTSKTFCRKIFLLCLKSACFLQLIEEPYRYSKYLLHV